MKCILSLNVTLDVISGTLVTSLLEKDEDVLSFLFYGVHCERPCCQEFDLRIEYGLVDAVDLSSRVDFAVPVRHVRFELADCAIFKRALHFGSNRIRGLRFR